MAISQQLTRIMTNARVYAPGALDTGLQQELFSVLDEFFQMSSIWTEDVDFQVTSEGKSYEVAPSSGQIIRLSALKNSSDIDVGASMPQPGQIELNYTPTQNDTLTATLVLSVVDPVTRDGYPECPDWISVKYSLGLTDGLIGRMMSQPAKPFSNDKLAIYYLKRFRSTIAAARADAKLLHLQDAQNWQFPKTFAR